MGEKFRIRIQACVAVLDYFIIFMPLILIRVSKENHESKNPGLKTWVFL